MEERSWAQSEGGRGGGGGEVLTEGGMEGGMEGGVEGALFYFYVLSLSSAPAGDGKPGSSPGRPGGVSGSHPPQGDASHAHLPNLLCNTRTRTTFNGAFVLERSGISAHINQRGC